MASKPSIPDAVCSHTLIETSASPMLHIRKVALVGKMTRYDFEKQRYDGYSEEQFKQALKNRGSNYDTLLDQHKNHVETLNKIIEVLKKRNIDYRICTRGQANYCEEAVKWADVIVAAGGDGTFLSAASKIKTRSKPLIGINTNPARSEGHLCLPSKYSTNFEEVLRKICNGKFRWMYRQRIRISMTGSEVNFKPFENGSIIQERMRSANRHASTYFSMNDSDDDSYLVGKNNQDRVRNGVHNSDHSTYTGVLPSLALNEVFIGESLSSVPSYYELQVDSGISEKQKSSGVCISTGTGSTAWSYSICRLHLESTKTVLNIARNLLANNNKQAIHISEERLAQEVTEAYGKSYVFGPSEAKMLYSIRDPMQNKVYRCTNPHSFAQEITIRSKCWDAALCIDGDMSYPFNDGASASLQVLPEDALQTIVLEET